MTPHLLNQVHAAVILRNLSVNSDSEVKIVQEGGTTPPPQPYHPEGGSTPLDPTTLDPRGHCPPQPYHPEGGTPLNLLLLH